MHKRENQIKHNGSFDGKISKKPNLFVVYET